MADLKLTRPNSAISDTEESYYRKRRSFASGFTITSRKEVLLWSNTTGGDGKYYQWMGSLPKTVPAGSTPQLTGGLGSTLWVNRGTANYLEMIDGTLSSLDSRVGVLERSPGGKSAYQVAVDNGFKGTETEWLASLKGTTGSGLTIRGSFGSTNDLPQTGNKPGDAYIIEDQMWVWDSVRWSPVGQVGPTGKSTYEVWLSQGNTGTEQDFLNSLVGPQGKQGVQGSKGETGENAAALIFKGTLPDVNSLPQASQENLNWTYVIGLNVYVSTGSGWVNLGSIQGPKGETGQAGKDGVDGKDGLNGKDGINGKDGQQGIQGLPGKDGAGIEIADQLADVSQLPTTGTPGEAYLVGPDNELYVWATGATSFISVGKIAGVDGKDGVGIGSYEVEYQSSTSGTTPPSNAWSTSVPVQAQGLFLWSRTTLNLTDNSQVVSYSVAYQGKDGTNGTNGRDGTDGVNGKDGQPGKDGIDGIDGHSVVAKGELNSVGDLPQSGNNIADMYYVAGNTYIWDGSQWVDMGTNLGPTGPAGPDGADGQDGPAGPQGSLWISLSGVPGPATGRVGDFYIDRDTNNYYQKTSDTQWSQLGTFGGGNVSDAPSDGVIYARQNASWVRLPVGEAPADGQQYVRKDKGWAVFALPSNAVTEAPLNTNLYARSNGSWVTFSPGIADAPKDGTSYVRKDNTWVSALGEAPNDGGFYGRQSNAWARLNRLDVPTIVTTVTMDASKTNAWNVDLSTNRTLTITNLPSGRTMALTIKFIGNGGTAGWTNTINWLNGTTPTYSPGATLVVLHWDGTSLIGGTPGGY